MEAAVQNEVAFFAITAGNYVLRRKINANTQTRLVFVLFACTALLTYNIGSYVASK